MAKTLLHKELKEKKKIQNEEFKKKHGLNFSKNAKLMALGICAILVLAPVLVFVSKDNKSAKPEQKEESVVVDDKYIIDNNGNITFLTGDEIIKSISDIYSASISTTYEGGSSNFTLEVDSTDNSYIEYYYGTKNNVAFDEVSLSSLETNVLLKNNNNEYTSVDNLTYSYIDCKSLIQSVLSGEELKEKDNVITSNIKLATISNMFPNEVIDTYYSKMMEQNDGELPTELLSTPVSVSVTTADNIVTVTSTCEFGTVNIEIKNIDNLSKDFSQYIQ